MVKVWTKKSKYAAGMLLVLSFACQLFLSFSQWVKKTIQQVCKISSQFYIPELSWVGLYKQSVIVRKSANPI